jgi:hypothetical protein
MEHISKFKETLNKIEEAKSILQEEYHKFNSMEMAQIRSIYNKLIEAEIEAEIFIKLLQKKS